MNIQLPTKKGQSDPAPSIEFNQLVIIGANGAGKTRFGSDIEKRYNQKTLRISAQKSLTMPDFVSTKSKEAAENEFLYGMRDQGDLDWYKEVGWLHNRWGNKLNTHLLNDYGQLMTLLHSEEYEQSLFFKENGGPKPITKLDRIQLIFEKVLPHRKIIKKAGVIETYPSCGTKDNRYNASEMSDGERVIFYLVGEAVCAPQDAIVIIDEPEMHIHKSLVKKLFDLIEIERPDCAFIYLTHDIDFAFTRQEATKIWAKSYEENDVWDYEILDEQSPIPQQLYLEVLGSRKPIIFLEGDNSSIDYELYEQLFSSSHTIKPLGSCEKVIQTVKAFNEQSGFHNLKSYGIIDRDRRPDTDISKLNDKNIWVLNVAEVENLLLEENIVKTIAVHMGCDPNNVCKEVKNNLIDFFKDQIENQIILHFKEILRRKYLEITNFTKKDIASVISEIDSLYTTIDKQAIYNEIKNEFECVIVNNDYNAILRLFNLKNALIPRSKVCELTGIRNREGYLKLVLTLLKRNDDISSVIQDAIKEKIIMNIQSF